MPAADGYRRAREAAEKALALDPQLVDAHLAMGWIQSNYDWDWEAADASYAKHWTWSPAMHGPYGRRRPGGVPSDAGTKRST